MRGNQPPLTPEPLGNTGLVTNTESTSPFRRFPWIQLVFCLACLAMTTWTWMRYSYCWHIMAREILLSPPTAQDYFSGSQSWPHDSYACVEGIVVRANTPGTDGLLHNLGIPHSQGPSYIQVESDTTAETGKIMRFQGRMRISLNIGAWGGYELS